ncbi:MAG: hypothetical protein ACRDTX_27830 [Pseudonocardiaceae bacterium]
MTLRLQRAVCGPALVTTVLALVAAVAPVLPAGWLLTWLLLGLASGYALSGST